MNHRQQRSRGCRSLFTSAGGAPTLLARLGGKGWLGALFLQAGGGTALTLGTVTVPTSDRLVGILGIMATVG